MYRWLCSTLLIVTAFAGCTSTGKKSTNTETAGNSRPSPATPPSTSVAQGEQPVWKGGTGKGELDGTMLAGRVVNSFGRPLPDASIRLILMPEESEAKPVGKLVEMQAQPDRDGYFVIPNLKPARDYLYIVSARDGDSTVAVFGNARPPSPKMVLTPTAEMAHNMPNVDEMLKLVRQGKQHSPEPPAATLETPQAPPSQPTKTSAERSPGWEATIDTPVPVKNQSPALGEPRPAGYVTSPSPWPPATRIEPPTRLEQEKPATPPNGTSAPPSIPPPLPPLGQGPKRPFCDLEGNDLKAFALRDMTGQIYEFHRNQHAKLVLLQFWHTTCGPCVQSIPRLKQWQSVYGGYGLEVIGICYEKGSINDQVKRVEAIGSYATIRGFNYPILLGGDSASCPVHTRLQVEVHPTFVLLDQSGRIVYHSKDLGFDAVGLEKVIRDRLGMR